MKRLLLFLAVFACLTVPLHSAEMNGEALAAAWDAYASTELESVDGVFYFAYTLGVVQGTDANGTLFDHVPGFSMARMALIVGRYIDKHRTDPDFGKEAAANIVTKAVLEVYPRPEVAGQNI